MICKTIKFDCEVISDDVSITKVSEKLDFKSLLERSAGGILDLRQFQLPRMSDLSTAGVVSDEDLDRRKMDLLNEPSSVVNNLFGSSVEDAEKEVHLHVETMRNNRKPKPSQEPPEPPVPPVPPEPTEPADKK